MPKKTPTQSSLRVDLFDGRRQPIGKTLKVLHRILDGNQKQSVWTLSGPSHSFDDLTFFNNLGDKYSVLVSAPGFRQAGFTPVNLHPDHPAVLDLMLIPSKPKFDFSAAGWDVVGVAYPCLAGGVTAAQAKNRYDQLKNNAPASLAMLLNLLAALSQIHLRVKGPLDYLQQIKWDTLGQDRFFAYCAPTLLEQVRLAAQDGEFSPEVGSELFHPGATASWKQNCFGEANVQLTFHENDRKMIDGVECIGIEPDIDYYKDLASHALFEVMPNTIGDKLTSPEQVYLLRWIAGRRAGMPEFDPFFALV